MEATDSPSDAIYPVADFLLALRGEAWMDFAACKGMTIDGTSPFFPERGQPTTLAYEACAACPVVAECDDYQQRTRSSGIWAGKYHEHKTPKPRPVQDARPVSVDAQPPRRKSKARPPESRFAARKSR